jgi:hypothetical protein
MGIVAVWPMLLLSCYGLAQEAEESSDSSQKK